MRFRQNRKYPSPLNDWLDKQGRIKKNWHQMIRCAEFFSGMGGMHFATQGLVVEGKEIEVVAAFDINQIANSVYFHNFGKKPITVNIEHLEVNYFEKLNCNAWLLSPPCQPYTRGGNMKDDEDTRAAGLLHLINVLKGVKTPPKYLFVENVLNFETSRSRNKLLQVLMDKGYSVEEYLVSPLDLGVPNYRLRYYLIAELTGISTIKPIITTLPNKTDAIDPVGSFLRPPSDISDWLVPDKYITEFKNYRHDIVHPLDVRSTTFTKSYGSKYIIGNGSFLQTKRLELTDYAKDDPSVLLTLGLRYFTPEEIALLHSFPASLQFPKGMSLINKYRLLGNSLNVKVVHELFKKLFITGLN